MGVDVSRKYKLDVGDRGAGVRVGPQGTTSDWRQGTRLPPRCCTYIQVSTLPYQFTQKVAEPRPKAA